MLYFWEIWFPVSSVHIFRSVAISSSSTREMWFVSVKRHLFSEVVGIEAQDALSVFGSGQYNYFGTHIPHKVCDVRRISDWSMPAAGHAGTIAELWQLPHSVSLADKRKMLVARETWHASIFSFFYAMANERRTKDTASANPAQQPRRMCVLLYIRKYFASYFRQEV